MTDRCCNNFCTFLEIERNGSFVKKLFRLNYDEAILEYFSDGSDSTQRLGYETQPDGSFNLLNLSQAADASSLKPKVKNCFYIVVCGQTYFLKAYNEKEKQTWIEKLTDASRIVVPRRSSLMDSGISEQSKKSGYKVEVVGGVILKTPMEESYKTASTCSTCDDSSSDEGVKVRSASPSHFYDEPIIKQGYGVKQGVFIKSWKNRYFMLTPSALQYSRTCEDLTPLRKIKMAEILDARISHGVHLGKDFMFEVVTSARVFYIQVNTASERDSWIRSINKCIQNVHGPKRVDVEIQTDNTPLEIT